jgi:hypothetical protein
MLKFQNILAVGIFYRIIIYLFLILIPFHHNDFGIITPLSFQEFADITIYKDFSDGENEFGWSNFFSNYYSLLTLNISNIDNRFPGPLFPIILIITQYSKDFTILLSLVIFFSEITAYIIWSYKKFKNYNIYSLLFFSFMPIPLYFGFMHSTDIIFYLLFTLLYFEIKDNPRKSIIIILFFLILCLRPNSLIIFISCLFYFLIIEKNRYFLILSSLFFLLSLIYYGPYFFYEMALLGTFEVDSISYSIFDIVFLLINYLKKVIFLLGFIPSDSGNNYFYLLRCFCGIIFLIGLIRLYYKKTSKLDMLFVGFFVFGTATVFFPAYRYILPITPILIGYFCEFFLKKSIN